MSLSLMMCSRLRAAGRMIGAPAVDDGVGVARRSRMDVGLRGGWVSLLDPSPSSFCAGELNLSVRRMGLLSESLAEGRARSEPLLRCRRDEVDTIMMKRLRLRWEWEEVEVVEVEVKVNGLPNLEGARATLYFQCGAQHQSVYAIPSPDANAVSR